MDSRADTADLTGGEPRLPLPAGPADGPGSVTAVIVARNEEANIEACLRGLLWADRILLIDDGSTDATAAIARRYTDWILPGTHTTGADPNHANLNEAFRLVPEGWILQVDADERVSDRLAREIREVAKQGREAAYRVPLRTAVLGRWMGHGYWGEGTSLIRFLRAGSAHYPLRSIHEALEVRGTVGAMHAPLYHLPYPTISEFVRKTERYTSLEVDLILKGESSGLAGSGRTAAHPSAGRLLVSTVRIFLWAFLRRGGWKDGRWGMATSLMLAQYALLETLKVWERAEGLSSSPPLPGDEPGEHETT